MNESSKKIGIAALTAAVTIPSSVAIDRYLNGREQNRVAATIGLTKDELNAEIRIALREHYEERDFNEFLRPRSGKMFEGHLEAMPFQNIPHDFPEDEISQMSPLSPKEDVLQNLDNPDRYLDEAIFWWKFKDDKVKSILDFPTDKESSQRIIEEYMQSEEFKKKREEERGSKEERAPILDVIESLRDVNKTPSSPEAWKKLHDRQQKLQELLKESETKEGKEEGKQDQTT